MSGNSVEKKELDKWTTREIYDVCKVVIVW